MKSSFKTLIISDLHNRVGWIEDFLKDTSHDKVVFLGDYFDSFYDTPDMAEKTARWLKYSLSISNRVHLFGNHDMSFCRPTNEFARCPGFSEEKSRRINHILNRTDWNKFKFHEIEQEWLLSHAGAHPTIFSHPIHGPSFEWIEKYSAQGLEAFNSNIPHPTYQYSSARGMSRTGDVGGLTWLDWNHEFVAIENLKQIVGHTICTRWVIEKALKPTHFGSTKLNLDQKYEIVMDEPKNKCLRSIKSKNWNIDCNNKIIGIIENGEFSWIPNKYITN
jgi:hypothetical protein